MPFSDFQGLLRKGPVMSVLTTEFEAQRRLFDRVRKVTKEPVISEEVFVKGTSLWAGA